ncbi:hypothetical protein CLV51_101718 [Chitinophaga niastensis]|uniref:CAAX prenyl protease 2/Lysostaphin resistance protein A-like domain-containing protein n=1 Tax=Chitinophaga niastensis TaxID=536980 RepID=A0A2P8HT39_CHINA|nr:CPBP family intramembrane glutamic endopeptidase [Chitinophaga niastensis]PSL49387.1 hypothetical protein CLV51_101718 [Chitinophaga niastensis]
MTGYLKQSPTFLQFVTFLGFFFGFFAVYIAALGYITPIMTGRDLAALQNGNLTDPNLIGYLKITQFFYTIVAYFVPAALFAYLWQPYPMRYIGLKSAPKGLQIILALLAMYGALPLAGWLSEWNQTWPVPQAARDMQAQAEKLIGVMLQMPTLKDLFINLILVAIVPAIAEELFFRGILQRLLIRSTRKVWLSVFITAILFSAVHGELLGFLPRVVLGFALGAIYVISGNLWLSILAHIMNNGLQIVWMYFFQHGMTKEDPSKDTPIAWYFVALSIPVTIGLFWALSKKSTPMPMIEVVKEEEEEINEDENL